MTLLAWTVCIYVLVALGFAGTAKAEGFWDGITMRAGDAYNWGTTKATDAYNWGATKATDLAHWSTTNAPGAVVNGGAWVLNQISPNSNDLEAVRKGTLTPDPSSRLGAYKATLGYQPGTVGYAVNKQIGNIYNGLGTFGEDQIGKVFNSPEAKALYNEPVGSDASKQMAAMELKYWNDQKAKGTVGGYMGSSVPVGARDWLQKYATGAPPSDVPTAKASPPGSEPPASADRPLANQEPESPVEDAVQEVFGTTTTSNADAAATSPPEPPSP